MYEIQWSVDRDGEVFDSDERDGRVIFRRALFYKVFGGFVMEFACFQKLFFFSAANCYFQRLVIRLAEGRIREMISPTGDENGSS